MFRFGSCFATRLHVVQPDSVNASPAYQTWHAFDHKQVRQCNVMSAAMYFAAVCLQGNLLWHDCSVRGGNSGSPVWVVWPPTGRKRSPSTAQSSLPEATASSTGRKLLQQDGGSSSSTSASRAGASSSAAASNPSGGVTGHIQVVGVHSSSLKLPYTSQLGAFAEALYAQLASKADTASSAAGPATDVCVGGAGGREADGVNVLLPVAVPFTADTYAWIDDVLQKHTCSGD
jgi:hypothetical protein